MFLRAGNTALAGWFAGASDSILGAVRTPLLRKGENNDISHGTKFDAPGCRGATHFYRRVSGAGCLRNNRPGNNGVQY